MILSFGCEDLDSAGCDQIELGQIWMGTRIVSARLSSDFFTVPVGSNRFPVSTDCPLILLSHDS